MIVFYSKNRVPIRLTDERIQHIIKRHPEMNSQIEKIKDTVEKPDLILEGDYGTLMAIKFFRNTPLTDKFLVVIYKEVNKTDGFILTAYFTTQFSKRRKIVWKP